MVSLTDTEPDPCQAALAAWVSGPAHLSFNTSIATDTSCKANTSGHLVQKPPLQVQKQHQPQQSKQQTPRTSPVVVASSLQRPSLARSSTVSTGSTAPIPARQSNIQAARIKANQSAEDVRQHCVDVLYRELSMMGKDDSNKPQGFDQPSVLAKIFLLFCNPLGVDLKAITLATFSLLTTLAHLIVFTSSLSVPAWLWLVRHHYARGMSVLAAGIFALGLLVLLLADWVSRQDIIDKISRRQGVFTADSRPVLRTWATPTTTTTTTTSSNKPATSQPSQPVTATRHATPGAAMSAAPHAPSPLRPRDDPMVRQVRQHIITLEGLVLGNTLSEGTLPIEVIPQRVQKLCEEVGLPWAGALGGDPHSTPQTLEQLDAMLRLVAQELGTPL